MNALLKAAVWGSLAFGAQVHAEVITYEFTATVTEIKHGTLVSGGASATVGSSDYGGFLVTLGEKVHGRFSFDTDTALEDTSRGPDDMLGIYHDNVHRNSISATFEQSGHVLAPGKPGQTMIGVNDWRVGHDTLQVFQQTVDGEYNREALLYIMDADVSPGALPYKWVPAIPNSIDAFEDRQFLYYSKGSDKAINVTATFTSVRQISPVPEPGTYAMLLAGLGLLGWQRKRQSRLR